MTLLIVAYFPAVGKEIHDAFSKIGFVHLSNHGATESIVKGVFECSKKFFELGQG
jgi:isopenicillin N synthase-like dioxygenase